MSGFEIGVMVVLLVAVGIAGFLVGRRRHGPSGDSTPTSHKRLEEYDFYPFVIDATGHVDFDPDAFAAAVRHLLDHPNPRAARQLIIIGEQNLVRDKFPSDWLHSYKQLYARHEGDAVVSDNDIYLELYTPGSCNRSDGRSRARESRSFSTTS